MPRKGSWWPGPLPTVRRVWRDSGPVTDVAGFERLISAPGPHRLSVKRMAQGRIVLVTPEEAGKGS